MTDPNAERVERAKHGPQCRTHMAGLMPNYGGDCTCGGDWTPQRHLEFLAYRIVSPLLSLADAELVAKDIAASGLLVAAPGTLAAMAREVLDPAVSEGDDDG